VAAAASSAPVPLARSKEAERRSTLRFMCPLSWSAGARAKGLAGGGGGGVMQSVEQVVGEGG
jgi:hypothetical protein